VVIDCDRQAGSVLDGAGILTSNILGSEPDVEHGGVDLRVSHQLLERRQGDSGPNHVGPKRVSKAVGIGLEDLATDAMMAE
jgi:hypothetical protein